MAQSSLKQQRINKYLSRTMSLLMLAVLSVILCSVSTPTALAESQEISVDVPFMDEPVEVEGVIFDSYGIQTITKTSTKQTSNVVVVTFSYDDELVAENAMASAVVKSASGEYSFGIVKALAGDGYSDSSFLLPACDIETPSVSLLRSQLSTLRQLVKVRTELRDKKRSRLNSLLSEQRLALIASAEKAFHTIPTEYAPELSADLPASELSDRLGRLLSAVQHYRVEKQRQAARMNAEETS